MGVIETLALHMNIALDGQYVVTDGVLDLKDEEDWLAIACLRAVKRGDPIVHGE